MRRPVLVLLFAALGIVALGGVALASSFGPASPPHLRDESETEEVEEIEECETIFEEEEADSGDERRQPRENEAEIGDCGEEEVETSGKPFVTAAPDCLVRRAESKIATSPGTDQVHLILRYTTYDPTSVAIALKAKDRKGSFTLLHATRHLAAKGALQLTAKVGGGLMDRVQAATEFDVALRAPRTPASCAGELEQRLRTVQHGGAKN